MASVEFTITKLVAVNARVASQVETDQVLERTHAVAFQGRVMKSHHRPDVMSLMPWGGMGCEWWGAEGNEGQGTEFCV